MLLASYGLSGPALVYASFMPDNGEKITNREKNFNIFVISGDKIFVVLIDQECNRDLCTKYYF